MRMNERIKKGLSGLLALTMVLSYVPLPAHAESGNLCDHHTEHTAECHYAEAVAGSPCTHAHSEDCYAIRTCLHECGTECEQGCTHECTVESGCITMELDCHHTHGDCGWSEGTAEVPCGHVHNESCGYVEAVAGTPCANAETDPECDHSGDCGYVAAVEGQPCGHTEHTDCGYAPATEGTSCTHTHAVKVDSADSCYKLLCSHKDGSHDDACGYVAAVEAHECHYECAECDNSESPVGDGSPVPPAQEDNGTGNPSPTDAPVCDCGTDDESIHATTCPVYVAPETAVCYCAEKCTDINIWCDVCGFDISQCGGTDTASVFEAEVSWVSNNGQSGTGTLSEAINALSDGGEVTLQSGFEMSDIQYITANIVLDLNGNYIDADLDPVFWLAGSGQITLTDTAGGGSISNQGGAVFQLEDDAKVTIEGGYMDGTDVIYAKENSTVTINGGEISGGYSGVLAEGNSKVTISGGSISGEYDIKISDDAAVSLVSDENGIGPTFPYGICVDGTTLNAILGEGAAYYLNGNQLDSVDTTATEITDGDVTVRAKCTHEITHVLNTADAAKHDEVCSKCGTWFSTDVHSGGTTTCTEKAVCVLCGADYGSEPEGHSGGDGTATCIYGQICEKCGTPYGEVDGAVHAYDTYTNGFYDCCGEYQAATDSDGDGCYEIGNAGQLYWFAQQVNGGDRTINAILTANIEVNKNVLKADGTLNGDGSGLREWTPIGDYYTARVDYRGNFDGKGHTISGLYFNNSSVNAVGLIGSLGGTVQNVGIIDSYFCGGGCVGAVVGEWTSDSITVTDCYNTGTVIGVNHVGGVAGNFTGDLHRCYNTGTVIGTGTVSGISYVGGVVGRIVSFDYQYRFTDCYNTGTVSGTSFVGGVAGDFSGSARHLYNTGNVSGTSCVGALLGKVSSGTLVYGYYRTGCAVDSEGNSCVGIGGRTDDLTYIEGKTAEQFASGEVAYLLQRNRTEEIWGQTIGTGVVPVLGGAKVYRGYTDCQATELSYSNAPLKTAMGHSPVEGSYTDNGSGTHSYSCNECGESVIEDHSTTAEGDKAATCIAKAYCSACESEYGEKNTANHDSSLSYDENGFCENGCYEPAIDSDSDGYYEIGNAGNLFWFAQQVNGGNNAINAVLTADIDLENRTWTPIGIQNESVSPNVKVPYTGIFNGQNHVIKNLNVHVTDGREAGLFGRAQGATLTNFGVENATVVSESVNGTSYRAGIIAGELHKCTVTNVYSAGNLTVTTAHAQAGGIGGECAESTLTSCYTTYGCLTASNAALPTSVTNCYYLAESENTGSCGEFKTTEQFASGEVAYLLQSGQTADDEGNIPNVWGQTLGTDAYPTLGGAKVYYGYLNCVEKVYTNTEASDTVVHHYENGFCTNTLTDGTVCDAYQPCEGGGTDTDPYKIGNAGNLYWFAAVVNGGNTAAHAELTADIKVNTNVLNTDGTLNGDGSVFRVWTPIGNDSSMYTGTFKGNGKTISGLYYNDSEVDYVGLFGYVGENGKVQNVGVVESYISGSRSVGGVAGYSDGGSVTNCYNTGTVSGSYVGGVVGRNINNTVTNCYNAGNVSGNGINVGGVAGYSDGGSMTNCYNTGSVSSTRHYTGGVVGKNSACPVTNCYNTGTVSGNNYVGGVAGANFGDTVTNSYNAGNVSGRSYVGGVAGHNSNSGTVTNCYFNSNNYSGNAIGTNEGAVDALTGGKTAAQFASGEVAYLLQSGQTADDEGNIPNVWGQTLGTDAYPTLGGAKVYYGYLNCVEKVYTNTEASDTVAHHYENGFCTNTLTDGTVCDAYQPCEGGGTDTDPYKISNTGNLYWFAAVVNGGYGDMAQNLAAHAELTADIKVNTNVLNTDGTLNGDGSGFRAWTPIGNESSMYTGTFNGNGKTISGLYYNDSEVDYVGLFGYVGDNGKAQNVGVVESYISGDLGAGGVAGYNYAGSVTNCYNTGTVSGRTDIGGVAGRNSGTVENCYNTGTVSGSGNRVGGVAGYNVLGTMTNCYNTGSVSGTRYYIGGVAGYNDGGSVTNCYNTGSVRGRRWIGGVAGRNNADSTVTNCYNTGSVSGSIYVGGVAGSNESSTVENCYYLNTAYTGGIDSADVTGSAEAKTAAQFASGEVCYLLNGDQSSIVFYQTCGEGLPAFSGQTVYQVSVICCDGTGTTTYSNVNENVTGVHKYEAPTFGWSADDTSCMAVFTCEACGASESLTCTVSAKTSDDGTQTVYTATVVKNGVTYTDTKTVDNEIISVNISWGSLNFTYTDGTGWDNPDTAWVQVENTGNTTLTVTYIYSTERTDITGSFFDGTSTDAAAVTAPVTIDTVDNKKKIWLRLDGQPSEALSNTTIGSVKLTIE